MSDGVLAAIIAAAATVFAALVQLKFSFAREVAARARAPNARNKSRLPQLVIAVMLVGAGVGGFALSQWVAEHRRAAQEIVTAELRARIDEMSRTESHLAGAYNDIESSVLRNIGLQGVVVMASVPPCKPTPTPFATLALSESTADASDTPVAQAAGTPSSACTEADASPVTLCATIPAAATVNDVELYVRAADTDAPWTASRVMAGQEADQARFAEQPVELADNATAKQVCERFVQWSTEHGRVARVVVRYTL
jgi:hypothetical protein